MKILLIHGVYCTEKVWQNITPYLSSYELDIISYPHEITSNAKEVVDITKWAYEKLSDKSYDAIIGHSLGGIIALQLAALYKMDFKNIIYLDTNLRPANEFYRNLMTPEHMRDFGKSINEMFEKERAFYTSDLLSSIQEEFDYTHLLDELSQNIYAVYGDRNDPENVNKINDLNLSKEVLSKLQIEFISNSCHMIMMENPEELSKLIHKILDN